MGAHTWRCYWCGWSNFPDNLLPTTVLGAGGEQVPSETGHMGLGASRPPLQRAQLTDQETVQAADLSKMPQLLKAETGQAPQATVLTPRL